MSAPTFPPMTAAKARKRIMVLAWCVAVEAPVRQNKSGMGQARIDWQIIHELRQRFTEAGHNVERGIKLTHAAEALAHAQRVDAFYGKGKP